jgi:hypothetical protein
MYQFYFTATWLSADELLQRDHVLISETDQSKRNDREGMK